MPDLTDDLVLSEVLNAHRLLLDGTGADDAATTIETALARIGNATGVDRVYIFQVLPGTGREMYASHRYEWTSSVTDPEINNPALQNIPLLASGYRRWLDLFLSYAPVVGSVHDFPSEEKPLLEQQGIRTILILPIYAGSEFWGFVGFDDCTEGRDWTASDIDLLITLSFSLGVAVSGSGSTPVTAASETYLRLIDRLLRVHAVIFSETDPAHLVLRSRVRMRVLAAMYRFVTTNADSQRVEIQHFFPELRPIYKQLCDDYGYGDLGELILDLHNGDLEIERALDIAILLVEVIVNAIHHYGEAFTGSTIAVTTRVEAGRFELVVSGRDRNGTTLSGESIFDGMAYDLFRHIRERLRAEIVPNRFNEVLFHVSIPI